jgi:hypothetical protein
MALRAEASSYHRHAGSPALGYGHGEHIVGQHTLHVVREDHHIGLLKLRFDGSDHTPSRLIRYRCSSLIVGAEQLLPLGDVSGLHRGGPPGFRDQSRREPLLGPGQVGDLSRGRVVACHRDQDGPRAERHHVAPDIADAAEHRLLRTDVQDLYRCFCGNAFDSAMHEPVEHDVADAEDTGSGKALQKALEGKLERPAQRVPEKNVHLLDAYRVA